jgi:hypothetical protein
MIYNLSRRIWLPLQCSSAWLLGLSEEREREREESRNAPQDSSERFRSTPLATWRLVSRPMRKVWLNCTTAVGASTIATTSLAFKSTAKHGPNSLASIQGDCDFWVLDRSATLGCALLDLVEFSLQECGLSYSLTLIMSPLLIEHLDIVT